MKKTLIALAVVTSAAVSGSAMASNWVQNSTGGSVELSGTLIPVSKITPWEVKTGSAVTGLDANIQFGQSSVNIRTNNAIPILGIRNANIDGFYGGTGIKPQIDYKNAVNLDGFKNGVSTITLPVKGESGDVIGSMTAPFVSAAISSWSNGSKAVYASSEGDSFFGGLGKSASAIRASGSLELIESLSSDFVAHWEKHGNWGTPGSEQFSSNETLFRGAYGAGIEKNAVINITLNDASTNDAQIKWNASLPITVTYQ